MCSRYHKWLRKESGKCARGCPAYLGRPRGAGTRGSSSAPLPAGALGVPVWTLLDAAADCRWMDGREDSPWYPTMRLFRPACPGAWEPVIARVVAALERRF
jgi:hypothetical protein